MAAGLGGSQLAMELFGQLTKASRAQECHPGEHCRAEHIHIQPEQPGAEVDAGFSPWIALESFLPLFYPCEV